jgi:hypothetical protein
MCSILSVGRSEKEWLAIDNVLVFSYHLVVDDVVGGNSTSACCRDLEPKLSGVAMCTNNYQALLLRGKWARKKKESKCIFKGESNISLSC